MHRQTDRQTDRYTDTHTDRIIDAAKRFTPETAVGVSNKMLKLNTD